MERQTLVSVKKQSIIGKINKEIDLIPDLPENIENIARLIEDEDLEIKGLAAAVEQDPALMFDVLKIANSHIYKKKHKVSNIERALISVGLKELTVILMRIAALRIIEEFYVPIERISKHSHVCARYARYLVKSLNNNITSELMYTAGLFHDIGKLILLNAVPSLMDKIDRLSRDRCIDSWELERLALGVAHAEVSARVVEKWGFPAIIVSSIKYHHDPLFLLGEERGIVFSLYLADRLSHYSTSVAEILYSTEPKVLDYFNISSERKLFEFLSVLRSETNEYTL